MSTTRGFDALMEAGQRVQQVQELAGLLYRHLVLMVAWSERRGGADSVVFRDAKQTLDDAERILYPVWDTVRGKRPVSLPGEGSNPARDKGR